VAGAEAVEFAEALDIVEAGRLSVDRNAGKMQRGVKQHRGVAVGKHEPIAVRPVRRFRIVAQDAGPKLIAHRRARLMGAPARPDCAFSTASRARVRMVSIARRSISSSTHAAAQGSRDPDRADELMPHDKICLLDLALHLCRWLSAREARAIAQDAAAIFGEISQSVARRGAINSLGHIRSTITGSIAHSRGEISAGYTTVRPAVRAPGVRRASSTCDVPRMCITFSPATRR
jgi:hypothetical protein